MDNRQLKIFATVAELQSFTRAAHALPMAQPAVSIAIKKLEHEVGAQLFDRSEKKILLTVEGEVLLQHAHRILEQFELAQLEMKELKGLGHGRVCLGASAMLASYYLPERVAAFRKKYPNLQLDIFGEGTQTVQEMILNGQLELGVVNMERVSDQLEAHPLFQDEIVACVGKSHTLAKKGKISMEEFFAEDLIFYRKGYYLRELLDTYSESVGIDPKIKVETDQLRLLFGLIQRRQGISLSLRFITETEKQLRAVSFDKPDFLHLGLAYRKGRYLSKACQAFMEFFL